MAKGFLILDTETTGFSPTADDITQLSILAFNPNGKFNGSFNTWFNTDKTLKQEVVNITKVNNEKLKTLSDDKFFEDLASVGVIVRILQMGLHWVGHNISFDESMIKGNCERYLDMTPKHTSTFCTMAGMKGICKIPASGNAVRYGKYKNPKLVEAIEWLKQNKGLTDEQILKKYEQFWGDCTVDYHDARYDTTCTYILWRFLNSVEVF